ncbi:MAG: hypothetical protein R2880_13450 [Deinococcales bacterium]
MFSYSLAFSWEALKFPEGDQSYSLEVTMQGKSTQFDIDIVQEEDGYRVEYGSSQSQIPYEDLSSAAFGGTMMGGFGAAAFLFGPSFMFLPMILANEDIAVRDGYISMMGMGKVYMEKTVEVAGHECVVVRMEMGQDDDIQNFEFALAENLPFPCYSIYGEGEDQVEIRLIRPNFKLACW